MTSVLSRLLSARGSQSQAERRFGIFLLVAVASLTVFDIVEDTIGGADLSHTLTEGVIVLISTFGAIYLWRRLLEGWRAQASELKQELAVARKDAEQWRAEAAQITAGLSAAIDRQLEQWGLSPAERDVAFLLIKGLSLKEIADARTTSERTVRQQAAAIYRKSALEGRAQLSAFFLEDLLGPSLVTRAG